MFIPKILRPIRLRLMRSAVRLSHIYEHRGDRNLITHQPNIKPTPRAHPAPLPNNEADRLKALHRYTILDTPAERAFDDLTALASHLCGTSIAVVSLVDAHRQWFKAKVGLSATETPRDLAFCAHAILKPNEPLIVPNALNDQRFATNPLVLSDPSIRFYAGVPLVTPDGFPLGTLCVIDQTPQHLTDQQIDALGALGRQVITQLELRIHLALAKQAEQEIHKSLEKEKELGQLKSRFISMASHEFRTPLTTIQGSVDLLELYDHKLSPEKKLIHLHRIRSNVQNMAQMLDDVLVIGKAEAGKLEFQPAMLDLEHYCRSLVEEMQLSVGERYNIAFTNVGEYTDAYLDEKLLWHILSNLLSNAIKYSPLGGTINFELACGEQDVVFQIKDTGIGIPPEDQKRLFEPFHRAKNVGKVSGTGLGMAIVKRSVEIHGGQITVVSEVDVGTTFTVTLPLHKQQRTNDKDFGN